MKQSLGTKKIQGNEKNPFDWSTALEENEVKPSVLDKFTY